MSRARAAAARNIKIAAERTYKKHWKTVIQVKLEITVFYFNYLF